MTETAGQKTFKFKVTTPFLEFLEANHVKTTPKGRQRWQPGDMLQAAADTHLHAYSMHLAGPHIMNTGAFSYSMSPLSPRVFIGRYCSIGPNVRLMGARHTIESVTTSEILYRGRRGMFATTFTEFGAGEWTFPENPSPGATEIGHDVWIGQDVLIKQGITIGTGAVIGAASLILKNVAPYDIVAGVPAKRIRPRFDENLTTQLLQSQWWQYAIPQHPNLPWTNPISFIPALAAAKAAGDLTPYKSDLGPLRQIVRKTA